MTAQIPEGLVYWGGQGFIQSNPLERYFEQNPPRPPFVPEHTANWLGYGASWAIEDGRLYLLEMEGSICTREPDGSARHSSWCSVGHQGECELRAVTHSDLFDTSGPVPAIWFSGELRVPLGDQVQYVHLGYATRYERYLLISVESGTVSGSRELTNEEDLAEIRARNAEIAHRYNSRKRWWQFWRRAEN